MLTIRVIGVPRPGGSKRAVTNKKTGKIMLIDACKQNKPWRQAVIEAVPGRTSEILPVRPGVALAVRYEFAMPRPKHHYRANGTLKPSAPTYHTCKPDATKCIRSTEDAMTDARIWHDDAQIASQSALKRYCSPGEPPGCIITIDYLEAP